MMEFELKRIVPRFLLEDRNGYAMAKAIEAGLKDFLAIAKTGLDTLNDTDKMPEWRLDELAWEYNIPYDYTADIEIKRLWISEAYELSRLYGTPEGIVKYLGAYFEDTVLEEAEEYGGEPFHFRMEYEGGWTPEKVAWASKAIGIVKNTRSVLDRYHFFQNFIQTLREGTAFYGNGKGTYTIRKQDTSELDYYADEDGDMLLDEWGHPMLAE